MPALMLERFLCPKKIEVLSSLELNGTWILFPLIGFFKNPVNVTSHMPSIICYAPRRCKTFLNVVN